MNEDKIIPQISTNLAGICYKPIKHDVRRIISVFFTLKALRGIKYTIKFAIEDLWKLKARPKLRIDLFLIFLYI